MGLANLAISGVGLAWLARFVGTGRVYALGMQPFLAGARLKALLAAGALSLAWRIARHRP